MSPANSDDQPIQQVTTFCENCRKESFVVDIEDSGKSFSDYWGQMEHFFSGTGKCSECGYKSYYSDSSL